MPASSHRGAQRGQLGGLLGAVALPDGDELDLGVVGRVADHVAQQGLEAAVVDPAVQLGQGALVADVVEGPLVVVEPAGQRLDRQAHAVGRAVVGLAQVELRLGQRRLEALAADAVARELRAGLAHERPEAPGRALAQAVQEEHHVRLQHAVDEHGVHVVGQARVQHAALERGLV